MQQMKEPNLINKASRNIISKRMKSNTLQWLIIKILWGILLSYIKLPSQLTLKIHIVPNSNRGIILTASDNKWSLETYIHRSDGTRVKSIEEVVKQHFFISGQQVIDRGYQRG